MEPHLIIVQSKTKSFYHDGIKYITNPGLMNEVSNMQRSNDTWLPSCNTRPHGTWLYMCVRQGQVTRGCHIARADLVTHSFP